jgi:peptide/nickel transport system substrate-binding protein/oligopeptide transport system substrate-binding protein
MFVKMNIFKKNKGNTALLNADSAPRRVYENRLSETDLNIYLTKISQFTDLLPAIMEGIKQLSEADNIHLTSIQEFQEKLTDIFHGQEEISGYSSLVLDTSHDYSRVIQETGEVLKSLIESFEQSLELNQKLTEGLENLSLVSRQLQELVSVMSDMSLTISQVSRNAEIKAFHAGNVGRGFGVIAENMNKLAMELRKSAGRAPELDSGFKEKISAAGKGLSQAKELAGNLKESSKSMESELSDIYNAHQQIVQGFQEMRRYSGIQVEIKDKLLAGIADISEITANLGINQEVVASVLTTEMAGVGQIEFIREQIEKAKMVWQKKPTTGNMREIAIKLKYIQSSLGFSVSRWHGLQESVIGLKSSALQEEKISAQVWANLEQLFGSIDGIGQEVQGIGLKLDSVIGRTGEMQKSLGSATDNLVQLQGLLQGFKNISNDIAENLEGLMVIGQGIRSFAEEVKLLAFYSAVEVAEMSQWGKELEGIVEQTRSLAQQAEKDSAKMTPMLDELQKQFANTSMLLDRNIEMVNANLDDILKANVSVKKVLDETKRFFDIGNSAKEGIDSQISNRNNLVDVYTHYANSFHAVSSNLDMIQRLFKQAHESLLGFGQTAGQLFGQIDERIIKEDLGGILKLTLPSEPITLDPAMRTDATSNEVVAQIFEGLVQFDAGVNVIPGIATHWNISADGLEWTFYLRKGVKFHNGRELTSDDVKYSLERLLDPSINSPNAYFVDMIDGASDYRAGRSNYVKGIRTVDPYTIKIRLESAYMPFLANLASSVTAIVPKEEVINAEGDVSRNPVGTGPFKLKEWARGNRIELTRFDDYYEQKISLKDIIYILNIPEEERQLKLESRQIDQLEVRGRERDEITAKNFCRVEKISALNIQYICINVNMSTPFVDKRVRQAINYAVNTNKLIDGSSLRSEATMAKGVFPPGLSSFNPDLEGYGYDPEKAIALLAQAGYANGLPGEYLMDIRDNREQMERAEFIINDCRKVGITVRANPLSWRELLERSYGGQSVLSIRGWSSDNGDPDNFLYPLFHSKNWGRPGNTSFYKSQRVDEMLMRALAIRNPVERLNFYRDIERMVVDDAPWIFLYHSMKCVATNNDVHGYRIRPMGAARLKDCWIEEQ